MKPFIALLKLSFKSLLLTTFHFGGGKKRAVSGVAAFAFLCGLMLFISSAYAFSMGYAFSLVGALDMMLLIMCNMATAFPFIFTVFVSQSLVFSVKDVDQVLSWPISSFKIMLARVFALYLEALAMCGLLLLPAGVAWLVFGGAGGVGFIVLLLLLALPMALIPTTLALAFGAVISLLISRLRFKNLLNVLFSVILVVLSMLVGFSYSFTMSSVSEGRVDIGAVHAQMAGIMPPTDWMVRALTGNGVWAIPYLAVSVLPFLAVTWVFSRFYKSMLTRLASHKLRSDYKLGEMRATGALAALLRKEARRFFGTPAYLLNGGIGYMLLIVACVAAIVKRSAVESLLAEITGFEGGGLIVAYLPPLLLAAVVFMLSFSLVSAASVSLEGRALWILKEAPVSTTQIFAAKAGFGALPSSVTALVSVPLLGVAFSLPMAYSALMLLVTLLFGFATSLLGLLFNLIFPRLDADNETMVIKNSVSVGITMLLSFLLYGLLFGLYFLLQMAGLGFTGFCAVSALLLAGLCALLLLLLGTKGKKLFAAL